MMPSPRYYAWLVVFPLAVLTIHLLFYVHNRIGSHFEPTFNQRLSLTLIRLPQAQRRIQCLHHALSLRNLTDSLQNRRDLVYEMFVPPLSIYSLPEPCIPYFSPKSINMNAKMKRELGCFLKNLYTPEAKTIIQRHLVRLQQAFRHARIELILDAGSLLGSWRHHGIIPYDDDIDFRIRSFEKPRVRRLLEELCRRHGDCLFKDTERVNQHWKLFIGCRRLTEKQLRLRMKPEKKCLLQIDFFFFWMVNDEVTMLEAPNQYPESVYYPLQRRPFEGLLMDTLHNFRDYFEATYGSNNVSECRSYDHFGKPKKECISSRTNCEFLEPFMPFVRRFNLTAGRMVEVMVDKQELKAVFVDGSARKVASTSSSKTGIKTKSST